MIDKPLPSNDEAEKVILGAIILDNGVIDYVDTILVPDDFYSPLNRKIFHGMLECKKLHKQIDPITVGEVLRKDGSLDSVGGVSAILGLTTGLPNFTNVEEYVATVRDHSISRVSIRMFDQATRSILSEENPVLDVLEYTEKMLLRLNNRVRGNDPDSTGFATVEDIVPTVQAQFERYHAGEITGVGTGIEELDNMLDGGGMQGKALYVVGGAEKSGKTSLVLEWMRHITVEQGKRTLIVTLEMSKETMLKRLFSMQMGIPYYMFRPGFYDSPSDKVYTRAMEGLTKFSQYPFMIADSLFHMNDIARYITRAVEQAEKDKDPIGAVAIDYMQLVGDGRNGRSQEERASNVSRDMKLLSADLDVPLIVPSSLNRSGLGIIPGATEAQEPDISNLRYSGSIAFDAEAVMFVHNPALIPGKPYEPKDVTDMKLLLSRQRNGPTGRIAMKFIGAYMSWMTDTTYNKTFGNTNTRENTQGQIHENKQKLSSLWEDDDDEWENS